MNVDPLSEFHLVEKAQSFEGMSPEQIQEYDKNVLFEALQLFYDVTYYTEPQDSLRYEFIEQVVLPAIGNSENYQEALSSFVLSYLVKEFDIYLDIQRGFLPDGVSIYYHCKNGNHIQNNVYEGSCEKVDFLRSEMSPEEFRRLREAARSLF